MVNDQKIKETGLFLEMTEHYMIVISSECPHHLFILLSRDYMCAVNSTFTC